MRMRRGGRHISIQLGRQQQAAGADARPTSAFASPSDVGAGEAATARADGEAARGGAGSCAAAAAVSQLDGEAASGGAGGSETAAVAMQVDEATMALQVDEAEAAMQLDGEAASSGAGGSEAAAAAMQIDEATMAMQIGEAARSGAQDAMAPAVGDGAGGPVRRKQSRRGKNKLSGPARQDRRQREGDDGE